MRCSGAFLIGFLVWPCCGCAATEIDRLVAREYPEQEPGAAVLISKAGKIILKKGYGRADTDRKIAVSPDTVFRLASLTKVFTGTAVLMLAEKGRLDLAAPVTKFIPAHPVLSRGPQVSHLLAHTSGLPDYLDRPDSMEWARHHYSVERLIDSFKDRPPSFAPGERSVYSNSNYILLGAIIEKVSGLAFGEFVRKNLFDPLGMKSTSCNGSLEGVPRLAAAYEPARMPDREPDWSRLEVARPYTLTALYAAGGCLSTVEDLATFNEALLGGRLLKKDSLARSFQPVVLNDGTQGARANGGWQLDTINGRRASMLGGALPGVCTWMISMPDDGVMVILLSNRTLGKPRCGMLAVKLAGVATGN